jgi:hypothetical protein
MVERAIRAARDAFERALVTEWDVRADSAEIRNAVRVLPYRCRQCGKPVAGIGNTCVCKTKIEKERFFSNPENEFRELFQQRCEGIATSASLVTFVETIGGIAVANNRDLGWLEDQTQGLLPSLKWVCRKWIIGICGHPFTHTGTLPAWFKDNRNEMSEADMQKCLSVEETEAELVRLEAEIGRCFDNAKEASLDDASLQMAQVVRLDLKRVSGKRARQDSTAAVIARIKRDEPGISIEQICRILDDNHWPLRESDKRAGFKTWHKAWEDLDHRPLIKRFISGIQPAAPQKNI